MIKEFKEFALRGSVLDMAVGIIIGAAFGGIISSLVSDVLMPPIGLLLGHVDFSNMYVVLTGGAAAGPYASLAGRFDPRAADALLERVALFPRRHDAVRTYSSGMKQRVKYAFALIHTPPVLVLDEPMSNLDGEGVAIVRTLMAEQRRGGILVVATNDMSDIDTYERRVDLNERA